MKTTAILDGNGDWTILWLLPPPPSNSLALKKGTRDENHDFLLHQRSGAGAAGRYYWKLTYRLLKEMIHRERLENNFLSIFRSSVDADVWPVAHSHHMPLPATEKRQNMVARLRSPCHCHRHRHHPRRLKSLLAISLFPSCTALWASSLLFHIFLFSLPLIWKYCREKGLDYVAKVYLGLEGDILMRAPPPSVSFRADW